MFQISTGTVVVEGIRGNMEFNASNLQSGALREFLPEVYGLRKIIENSDWHDHQNAFEHTICVVEQIDLLLARLGAKRARDYWISKTTASAGVYDRAGLLTLSAMLHNIGKMVTVAASIGYTRAAQVTSGWGGYGLQRYFGALGFQ